MLAIALTSGAAGAVVALVMLWGGEHTPQVRWTLSVILLIGWLGGAIYLRHRVVVALQTASNLLSALRDGDYSVRARAERSDDAMGELMQEVNLFAAALRDQRLGEMEATTLLGRVMSEIDAVVLAFDVRDRLRSVNPAGERLLGGTAPSLLGRSAQELGLSDLLTGEQSQPRDVALPGGRGRWGLRRATFRQDGLPHKLILLLDLSRALREEELLAWQRLVRVLGHELNNSLAPITSISDSMQRLLARDPRPDDWEADMRSGLNVIANRAGALSRFLAAYSRLARLPRPVLESVDVAELIDGVVRMETRHAVAIVAGPDVAIRVDRGQIEQVLINLIHNAVDAVAGADGGVSVSWQTIDGEVEIAVQDDGQGIANPANVFIPFFTTKQEGSGIGLVLSRQIMEAHGGALTIENRTDRPGCVARVRVPRPRLES